MLLPIRLRLEQYAAHVARSTAPTPLWEDLEHEVSQLRGYAERGDLRGVTAADVAFHRLLIEASHSAYAAQVWKGAESRVRMQFGRLGKPQTRLFAIAEEHRALLDVLRTGEPREIDCALEDHIIGAAERLLAAEDGDADSEVPGGAALL